jgi:hypothetical protein
MSQRLDWQKDYFRKDPWFGLNDWEPVLGFVRALMEDSEVPWCFEFARKLILDRNTPLSQTLIQYLGWMQDARSLPILRDKLALLDSDDRTFQTPWCEIDQYFEWLCLQSLAKVGGAQAKAAIDATYNNPEKSYLFDMILTLQIGHHPRPSSVPLPADFPEILKNIHSMNAIFRQDDDHVDGVPDWLSGTEQAAGIAQQMIPQYIQRRRTNSEAILRAWRSLPFPGRIEYLSGDGHTILFNLKQQFAGLIHNQADPFSDMGVFISGPKVEHPIGRRRWAHSHTFLHYAFPDGSFWNNEYTWDESANTITTHFHEHVPLEAARVNADGRSVTVSKLPISSVIETRGNVFSAKCNAAVRAIWDNPNKVGRNYYVRHTNTLIPYKDLCMFSLLHQPIVNIHGCWLVDESERPERFFNPSGECIDIDGVVNELLIPLHEPKVLALSTESYKPTRAGDTFARRLPESLWPELIRVPSASKLDRLLGVRFEPNRCGLGGWETNTDNGYNPFYDLNSDGVIDDRDQAILAAHQGEVYRDNLFHRSYFGENWVGTSYGSRSRNFAEQMPIYICSYTYGAGYDPDTGRIKMFETAPPDSTLYVEYYYDAPALPGKDNIKVYLMEPLTEPIRFQPYVPAKQAERPRL